MIIDQQRHDMSFENHAMTGRELEFAVYCIENVAAALGVGGRRLDGSEDLAHVLLRILVDGGARAVSEQPQRGENLVRPGLCEADKSLVLGFWRRWFHGMHLQWRHILSWQQIFVK